MATSPIYSWPEPDNTDLVKNGALAIRTLGNAIDTTMATMTPKSLVDAKGDLIAATANDTPARLAVGSNGETLVADSSTATGLRYTAGTVNDNPVLNSSFQVWQRGTSFNSTGTSATNYTADRWINYNTGTTNVTVSRQATGDTTNLPFIQYCARVQRNSGNTNTSEIWMAQVFETINSIPLAGKTLTVSFYARRGANYSATSNNLSLAVGYGTGTDQALNAGVLANGAINGGFTLTTTWQRFSVTGNLAAAATQIAMYVSYTPTGTAGANDFYEITGFQIDVGSVALPFRTNGGTIQGETSACQRYYTRVLASSGNNYYYYAPGIAKSTTVAKIVYTMPVTMRVSPTAVEYSGLSLYDTVNAAIAVTAVTTDTPTLNNYSMDITVASGLTQYRPYFLFASNQSGGYFGLTAEL